MPRKRRYPKDQKTGDCKNCGWGIFSGQPTQWQNVQPVGLVHTDCEKEAI